MPFKSKAQERYLFANHPDMAQRWANETPDQGALPERVGKSMKPTMKPKSNPKLDAISDLHKMLSGAIASHLKAKKSAPAPAMDPEEADEPENDNSTPDSAQEEASENQLAAKNKKRFGPGHKK